MTLAERQRTLDVLLSGGRALWHPQPFCEVRPGWCDERPALAAALLSLGDEQADHLNNEAGAAVAWLATYLPDLAELASLAALPALPVEPVRPLASRWAWEIPGRKQAQIEAFAAAARCKGSPVLDWCGGKGHLGRLLAQQWDVPVHTLELDPFLCDEGRTLAARQQLVQGFVQADALSVRDWPQAGQHAVALHACGELHRQLVTQGAVAGVTRFDVAPCCYYRGVAAHYQPLSAGLQTVLSRDDTRLAVTETVTASPRLTRQRDQQMAWKLAFAAWRSMRTGEGYRSFKPVPAPWFRGSFATFLGAMAERHALAAPTFAEIAHFESVGWQRQREVIRLSIVRHAFRRALEVWLVLDLAVYLEAQGYVVSVGQFCERRLTPRNVLISAWRA